VGAGMCIRDRKDRVQRFYPQGSMAVGATITSKLKTDEFDIDVVAQLDLPTDVSPQYPLDLLFEAIRGEPGSRYYQMAKRRTRCVTVDYSDMHLDVTPAVRMPNTAERQSWIFHHRPEEPRKPGCKPVANPYGFAEWFKHNTPPDLGFASFFEARADEYERCVLAEAEKDPVPEQESPFRKSKAIIVLQLLKRWRNVQYGKRSGRQPPSIVIAKLVADAAGCGGRLSEELLHQARSMLDYLRWYHDMKRRVRVVNPECALDVLTDRWPGSLPERPILCLYDPATNEWSPDKAIAKTIIPWTIDWLACYEGWLATGEWTGGGRHPTSE